YSDRTTTVEELKELVGQFCEEMDWKKFHNAKDLSVGISIESAELMEIFRWKNLEETESIMNDDSKREKISHELADILYFLLRFSDEYDIDLSESLREKIEHNRKKYPVEKFKGSAKKYDE
ncbi:MAG TPA: nucleotide pyrophosphohydrolase, partial [Allocoleopsis sp.]